MKTFFQRLVLFVVVVAIIGGAAFGLITAYREMSKGLASEAASEKPVMAESHVKRDSNGLVRITLDEETLKRIGMETAPLAARTLPREIKAYGRVIDPAPLAALSAEITAAELTLAATTREWERVKKLYDDGQNASRRAFEAAETLMRKDQLTLNALRDRVAISWGPTVAAQKDLIAFVRPFIAWEKTLIRLDLTSGDILNSPPAKAQIASLANERVTTEAPYFGMPVNADPLIQSQGFLFMAQGVSWPPGTAVVGSLTDASGSIEGVVIPRSSIVRAFGKIWVYARQEDNSLVRRPVELGQTIAEGWLVVQGWKAGERVVITGAQLLLSEEFKSQIQLVD